MNVCLLVTPQYRDIRVEFHKGIYVWYRYVYSVRLVSVCGYTCGIDMSILFVRLPRMCVDIYLWYRYSILFDSYVCVDSKILQEALQPYGTSRCAGAFVDLQRRMCRRTEVHIYFCFDVRMFL